MKVKELIEELKKYNPDGVVECVVLDSHGLTFDDTKVIAVEDAGCALINPRIVAQ